MLDEYKVLLALSLLLILIIISFDILNDDL